MALIPPFIFLFFFFFLSLCLVNSQPSPGYYPSTKLSPLRWSEGYNSLWSPQHQTVSQDQSSITIWLDQYSGKFHSSLSSKSKSDLDQCREWIQVENAVSKRLLRCFSQASEWLHSWSEHSILCE